MPILEKSSKLKFNKHFFCGYSPERINPGDKKYNLKNIIKVTSGSNEKIAKVIDDLYKSIIDAGTFKASSIEVAEAAKVIENTQRDVNIALMNELSIIFNKLDLDTSEILQAAKTKWNFLPFSPGLVGGHCIGVDPYYLTHKAKEIGYRPEIILAGRRLNDNMASIIVENTIFELAKSNINPIGANIGVLGLTFKEDCPDLRNTQVFNIIAQLKKFKCNLKVCDPYVNSNDVIKGGKIPLSKFSELNNLDALIIAVAHKQYRKLNQKKITHLFKDERGVLIDVKSVFKLGQFSNSKIRHWRL